jgi:hypothetical protein
MRNAAHLIVVLVALCWVTVVSGCADEAGSYAVSFTWEALPENPVWVWIRVEERADAEKSGTILASAGPEQFVPGNVLDMALPDVANGTSRRIIAEVRAGANANLPLLYFGVSDSFALRAGKHVSVDVPLLLAVPEADKVEAEVTLLFDGTEVSTVSLIKARKATVSTRSAGVVSVALANDASFMLNRHDYDLSVPQCTPVLENGVEWTSCLFQDYDLTDGLPPGADGQEYTVYVRFTDRYGYESQVYKRAVVVDQLPPSLTMASVSPPVVRVGQTAVISVSTHEPLAQEGNNQLLVLSEGSELPDFDGPVRVGKSTTYLWSATIESGAFNGVGFTFSLVAEDAVGNLSDPQPLVDSEGTLLSLLVDSVPPALSGPLVWGDSPQAFALADDGQPFGFIFYVLEASPPDLAVDDDGRCLSGCPTVRVGSKAMGGVWRKPAFDQGDLMAFSFQASMVVGDWGAVEQTLPITIEWVDGAGNPMVPCCQESIAVDFVPPTAVACKLSPDLAGLADTLVYSLTASEPLAHVPQLSVEASAAAFQEATTGGIGATVFVWTEPATTFATEIVAVEAHLTDLAGNASTDWVCPQSVSVDAQAPLLGEALVSTEPVVLDQANTVHVALGPGSLLHVSVTAWDDRGLAEGYPVVQLEVPGNPQTMLPLPDAQPPFTHAFELDMAALLAGQDEGYWPIRIELADESGNTLLDDAGGQLVRVDFTPPQAECTFIPTGADTGYPLDTTVFVQVSPFEALSPVAGVVLHEAFAPPLEGSPFFTYVPGTTYRFGGQVAKTSPGSDALLGERLFTVDVTLTDLVGNATPPGASACTAGTLDGLVDAAIPAVSLVAVTAIQDGEEVTLPEQPLRTGAVFQVELQLTGTAKAPEAVTIGGQELVLLEGPKAGLDGTGTIWRFGRTLNGEEAQGPLPLEVAGKDEAGNSYSYVTEEAVAEFDFTPPDAVAAALYLTAPEGSWLQQVQAVTNGTTVGFTVTASEVLSEVPQVVATRGAVTMAFEPVAGEVPGDTFGYEWVPANLSQDGAVQGAYEIGLTLIDRAGNLGEVVAQTTTPLVVDSIPPDALVGDYQASLLHYRNPWGSTETGGLPTHELRGCGPQEGDDKWDWCPPALPSGLVEPESLVSVLRTAMVDGQLGCSDQLLATLKLDGDSDHFAIDLHADVPGVCVVQTDLAGNTSVPAGVRRVEWVATLNNKLAGDTLANPHRAFEVLSLDVDDTPAPGAAGQEIVEQARLASLYAQDDDRLETVKQPDWVNRTMPSGGLPEVRGAVVAYDPLAGETVVFGGARIDADSVTSDLWTYDGSRWRQETFVGGPQARMWAAGDYNPLAGRLVIFGGKNFTTGAFGDTWEWDGVNWYQSTSELAPPKSVELSAMAWSPAAQALQLFVAVKSGKSWATEFWSYQAGQWQQLTDAENTPVLGRPSLAFDAANGQMVVTGAVPDDAGYPQQCDQHVWRFVAGQWVFDGHGELPTPDSFCSTPTTAWDPAVGALALAEGRQVYYWLNGAWQIGGEWGPRMLLGRLLWDARRAVLMVISSFYSDLIDGENLTPLERHGEVWRLIDLRAHPGWMAAACTQGEVHLAYVPELAGIVAHVCGENSPAFRVWDGFSWQDEASLDFPHKRKATDLLYDGFGGRLLMLAEVLQESSYVSQFWGWSDGQWEWLSNGSPGAFGTGERYGLVADDQTGRVYYLVGGLLWPQMNAVWEAGAWQTIFDFSGPVETSGATYDPDLKRIVAASEPGTWFLADDTWTWHENGWTPGSYLVPSGGYGPRALAYDDARKRVLLHECETGRFMEFDGTYWSTSSGLSAPSFAGADMAWLPHQEQALLIGTNGPFVGGLQYPQLWTFEPTKARPHIVVGFDLASANTVFGTPSDPVGKTVLTATVVTEGGAMGYAGNEAVPGYRLQVHTPNVAPWVELFESDAATPDATLSWSGSFDADWSCPGCLAVSTSGIDYWRSAKGWLYLAVSSLAGNGKGPDGAAIVLDYVELRLLYERQL